MLEQVKASDGRFGGAAVPHRDWSQDIGNLQVH
jgi:hypothetical protein